jgi:ribonuclease BN (tRNA processing enzyme)
MKITVIGCGGAFSNINFNQCLMLDELYEVEPGIVGHRMLVDCGQQVTAALHKARIPLKSITDIYISHGHGDHIGSLENIAYQRYDWANKPRSCKYDWADVAQDNIPVELQYSYYAPTLIANDRLMQELWDQALKLGLSSIEGLDATLETYFWTKPMKSHEKLFWAGWDLELVQQIHIMTGSTIANTFGLFMTRRKDGFKVYHTTDSQHCSPRQVEVFYKKADVIFQDCECLGVDAVKRNMDFCSGVHANYAQLAGWDSANSTKLSKEIKAKMWLCHYADHVTQSKDYKGQACNWDDMAKADGFRGFIKLGQEIEV